MTTQLEDLRTPAAIVDLDRLERNTARMRDRARRLGVFLRPHVKTHKCVEAGRLQHGGETGPITVSTLAEARHFADAGFDDITWAVPIAPSRLSDVDVVADRVRRMAVLVDDAAAVDAVEAHARRTGRRRAVWLEIDCGDHRSGAPPHASQTHILARRLAESRFIDFVGLLTHAGQSYAARTRADVVPIAELERRAVAELADALRVDGIEVPEVSVGSTPTACAARDLTGVTDMRPGNYVFFDAFQVVIGSCGLDDVAFTVLATVIARAPARGTVVVDAGALALSKDVGARHVEPDAGFGLVVGARARIVSLSQEHGIIRFDDGGADRLRIGDHVRLVPNHSCLAAALHDRYAVVCGHEVVHEWRPIRGWTVSPSTANSPGG